MSKIRFNPRAHAGRDGGGHFFGNVARFQSTRPRGARRSPGRRRTPTSMFQSTRPRGARRVSNAGRAFVLRFNPRAHAGRDDVKPGGGDNEMFQSTRPRGARRRKSHRAAGQPCFNPRAHAGRDTVCLLRTDKDDVSIHAPTRGATTRGRGPSTSHLFQSTRPRGARPQVCG